MRSAEQQNHRDWLSRKNLARHREQAADHMAKEFHMHCLVVVRKGCLDRNSSPVDLGWFERSHRGSFEHHLGTIKILDTEFRLLHMDCWGRNYQIVRDSSVAPEIVAGALPTGQETLSPPVQGRRLDPEIVVVMLPADSEFPAGLGTLTAPVLLVCPSSLAEDFGYMDRPDDSPGCSSCHDVWNRNSEGSSELGSSQIRWLRE